MHEALDAHLWWEKGQLGQWMRGRRPAAPLNLYVGLVASAVADADIERMAEIERERKK